MPQFEGALRKMRVSVDTQHNARYQLVLGEHSLDMNDLLGKQVRMEFTQQIHCVHCQTKTKKSFNQGYCYRCFIKLAQCDSCIVRPELCHYHEGTCREPQWGEDNCLQDHFVYLANTGTVKVGITRHVTDGVSSRWIDQGATQAIPLLRVANRRISGLVETACKTHIADKTNWRTMLKSRPEDVDLVAASEALLTQITADLEEIRAEYGLQAVQNVDGDAVQIHYPVLAYPSKLGSLNLDKQPVFSGQLNGIKGQYWMLDNDKVINIRKFAGYQVRLHHDD